MDKGDGSVSIYHSFYNFLSYIPIITLHNYIKEKVVILKDMTKEEATREIKRVFATGRTLYYSDIAEELGLSLKTVVEICRELQSDGEIGIDNEVLAGTR